MSEKVHTKTQKAIQMLITDLILNSTVHILLGLSCSVVYANKCQHTGLVCVVDFFAYFKMFQFRNTVFLSEILTSCILCLIRFLRSNGLLNLRYTL